MKRIGIMGGTFNPIHIGHLMLAEWAMQDAALDEVWVIPSGISYMKAGQNVLPGAERLKMVQLAISDNPGFKGLDTEIIRSGYTYSFETLELLREQYPDFEFFFIVGADCLFTIENWKFPERIFDNCTLLAAVRGEANLTEMEAKKSELEQKFNANICLLPFLGLNISSTEIRNRIKERKSVRYMIPETVRAYIEEKGFYCEES